jgi:DNA repair exonuclease SbcCD ATPase subunit
MLITGLSISEYKRVRTVNITPAADRHIILIGGKNRQGKSSILDALTAAFGGAKAIAADPVHHGADEAAIYVELDGGKLTIDRTITPDGKTQLEVRDDEGALRRPQEVLDALVGSRFLDPLAFLRLTAKDQRAQLMKLIPDAARIDELNKKRERAFDRRRELGQDLTKAKGELARLAEVPVGDLVDVEALAAEQRAFGEQQRSAEAAYAEIERRERDAVVANDRLGGVLTQIEDLKRALAQLESRVPEMQAELVQKREAAAVARADFDASADAWKASERRRIEIDRALASANDRNRAVFEAQAQNKRRAEAQAAVDKLDADYKACTTALDTVDARKAEILGKSPLPVEGLAIGDDCILLAGVPFAQAAQSEQWRVALALAIAGSPGLNDVWIKDGAVLDDEALELVAKLAAAAGKHVWVERVGTKDAGVIVIQDGQVAP